MGVIGLRVVVTASVEVETTLPRVGIGDGVNARLLCGSKEAVWVEPDSLKGVMVAGAKLVLDTIGPGEDCNFILELQLVMKRRRIKVERNREVRIIPSLLSMADILLSNRYPPYAQFIKV